MADGILGLGTSGSVDLSSELLTKLKTAESTSVLDPITAQKEDTQAEIDGYSLSELAYITGYREIKSHVMGVGEVQSGQFINGAPYTITRISDTESIIEYDQFGIIDKTIHHTDGVGQLEIVIKEGSTDHPTLIFITDSQDINYTQLKFGTIFYMFNNIHEEDPNKQYLVDLVIDAPITPPVTEEPSESEPDESTPSEETPDESTPSEETPSESEPDESTPDESTPSESTPDESTPSEETPSEETPSEETPSEETPSESTPVIDDSGTGNSNNGGESNTERPSTQIPSNNNVGNNNSGQSQQTGSTKKVPKSSEEYLKNKGFYDSLTCKDLHEKDFANMVRSHAGYTNARDRDNDGFACDSDDFEMSKGSLESTGIGAPILGVAIATLLAAVGGFMFVASSKQTKKNKEVADE